MQNENIQTAQDSQIGDTRPDQVERKDIILDWVFRAGFGSVFLINSLTSLFQPDSFLKLLDQNFIANQIGHDQLLLYLIAINDLILGVLILSGIKKKYVYAWAGIWLAIVTFFKATSLI